MTESVSDAASPLTAVPLCVALTSLLKLLEAVPGVVSAGTCRVTLKVCEESAASVPPVSVIKLVPDRVEPAPMIAVCGKSVATSPDSTLLKSSVKPMSVSSYAVLMLVTVYSSVTVSPGLVGSSVNCLENTMGDAISSVAEAGSIAMLLPSTSALRLLLALT